MVAIRNRVALVNQHTARRMAQPVLRACAWFRRLPLGSKPAWRKVPGGFDMLIDPSDPVDLSFHFGSYERHLLRLIKRIVRAGDLCIDVGAHKGFVTLQLAHAAGPAGRVICIEPDERAMAALKSHCERNGVQNAILYACAIGNAEGELEFSLSHRIGWSSSFPNELARTAIRRTVVVPTRTLDDIVSEARPSQFSRLSLIKVDVEGAEPLVLAGARNTIETFHPAVHIEVNKASLRAAGKKVEDVSDPLLALGYKIYAFRPVRRGPSAPCRLRWMEAPGRDLGECEDIVALHPGQPETFALPQLDI
jgi:FkbM family methyltransferase